MRGCTSPPNQENPWIFFAESSLINDLRRPPPLFFFVRRFRPKGGRGTAWTLLLPLGLFVIPSVFISGFSGLAKQGKGWRRFESRTLGIISVRLGGCGLQGNRESVALVDAVVDRVGRPPDQVRGQRVRLQGAIKTGRSIRCPARMRPLERARSGSSLWPADGRQPFMPASVSQCLSLSVVPSVSPFEAEAAAFRRARS